MAKKLYIGDQEIAGGSGSGGGGSTPDLTNYATKNDISTFKPIVYTNISTYEDMEENETLDQDTMYVITDLASSEDLATLVTVDDLSTYKNTIIEDVSTTANTVISDASASINSIKTSAISAVQSQQSTSVSAVSTAQSTAVNAVNSAKNTAISDISTYKSNAIADMPTFAVMTESDYNNITPNSSTIYFLT